MEEEIWKPLVYHGEYFGDTHEISNLGNLRNAKTKRIYKTHIDKYGYEKCNINQKHKQANIKVHRAVAENFVDGDTSLTVNHKDLNKLNNRWDNLEFVTQAENIQHAIDHDAFYSVYKHVLNRSDLELAIKLRNEGKTFNEISEIINIDKSVVRKFCNGAIHKSDQDLLKDLTYHYRNDKLERDDLAVIADLWRQGKNFTEIGNKVGVSRHVVADYIHRKTYRRHQDLLDDDD